MSPEVPFGARSVRAIAELAGDFMSGPCGWLITTLAIYAAASALQRRLRGSALANPTLITIVAISGLLIVCDVSHSAYAASTDLMHALLGTCVVALAIPMQTNLLRMRGRIVSSLLAVALGSVAGTSIGVAIAMVLGASPPVILSIAPKSATAAVSMEIAAGLGGLPAVAGCVTIMTGIIGAVLGPSLLTMTGVTGPAARGLAFGTASHGIATARALSESEETGAWSALAMCLNAVFAAMTVPAILHWAIRWSQ